MIRQTYIFLVFLFFSLLVHPAFSQGWAKKYSPDHEMRITSAFQRQDNTYWVWGANMQTNRSTRLMRISPEGYVLQVFDYDTLSGINGKCIMTRDEGMAIFGDGAYNENDPQLRKRTLIRTDHNGNLLWRKDIHSYYLPVSSEVANVALDTTLDNGFICGLNSYNTSLEYAPILLKRLSKDGNVLWENTYYDSIPEAYVTNIKSLPDGGFIVQCGGFPKQDKGGRIFKIDGNGNFLWEYNPSFSTNWINFEVQEDNSLLVQGNDNAPNQTYITYFGKLDTLGNELWTQKYPALPDSALINSFVKVGDSIAAITIQHTKTSQTNKRLGFVLLDTLGNILSHNYLPTSNFGFNKPINPGMFIRTADKGYLLCTFILTADIKVKEEAGFLIKMNSTGRVFSNSISGHVFYDRNEDCMVSPGEEFIQRTLISYVSATDTFRTVTQRSGDYFLWADPGTYTVDIKPVAPYWEETECNPQQVVLEENADTVLVFGLHTPDIDLPYLTMSGNIRARICAEGANTYTLQYCNEGSEPFNGLIFIKTDDIMQVDSASVPINNSLNTYYMLLNENPLPVSACGEIKLYFSLPCEINLMGNTICVEAFALPDYITNTSSAWDKSDLTVAVEANTAKDSVLFSVKNEGTGDMSVSNDLEIIEDETVRKIQALQLMAGETYNYKVEANGSTWRATIAQTEGNPNSAFSTNAVEGVGLNSSGKISKGFISKFPLYGDYAFRNVACNIIRSSYDPNQKTVYPMGAGEEKIVKANTPLEYVLEFQNTGNAPAHIVRLVDTLSPYLDPSTIITGASSHPYTFRFLDEHVIEFTFEAINLPDKTSNEPGSHGFVRFKINQQPDNAIGTLINNQVAIYFDYNPPVITNIARVQIGTYHIDVITGIKNSLESINNTAAFPNPFDAYTIIRVEGADNREMDLTIYDSKGISVYQQHISNTNQFTVTNLPDQASIYFYKIWSGNVLIGQGKLVQTK